MHRSFRILFPFYNRSTLYAFAHAKYSVSQMNLGRYLLDIGTTYERILFIYSSGHTLIPRGGV